MPGFESRDLITYLEGQPGVTPIRDGSNPATWCARKHAWGLASFSRAAGKSVAGMQRAAPC